MEVERNRYCTVRLAQTWPEFGKRSMKLWRVAPKSRFTNFGGLRGYAFSEEFKSRMDFGDTRWQSGRSLIVNLSRK
jgi:hypothetical protein